MDGLKDCVPFGKSETQLDLFGKHTDRFSIQFCKIMDWGEPNEPDITITYRDLKGGL